MSSRQDTYKSLCLIEAQKSPLHYRHGCIIVCGGKVIGKGHNHYRPRFNGGALSTARTSILSAPALGASLDPKKNKQKDKSKPKNPGQNSGGGSLAQTPLSMHSEMMAIRAALSLSAHDSGASARGTAWSVKPSFKLSGHSKRVARLRSYVEAVCAEAERAAGRIDYGARPEGKEWYFEQPTSRFESAQKYGPQRAQDVSEEREQTREEGEEPGKPSSRVSVSVPVSS